MGSYIAFYSKGWMSVIGYHQYCAKHKWRNETEIQVNWTKVWKRRRRCKKMVITENSVCTNVRCTQQMTSECMNVSGLKYKRSLEKMCLNGWRIIVSRLGVKNMSFIYCECASVKWIDCAFLCLVSHQFYFFVVFCFYFLLLFWVYSCWSSFDIFWTWTALFIFILLAFFVLLVAWIVCVCVFFSIAVHPFVIICESDVLCLVFIAANKPTTRTKRF